MHWCKIATIANGENLIKEKQIAKSNGVEDSW
jgi:hypothetical protein